ncbi:MAG TPA: rhomboid family intramembrane serine protease [Candidatus Omnitrophica bacterium]|nr:rhomboid family intramembrane serine protease [Candidatus Omnitrophota bacterium]
MIPLKDNTPRYTFPWIILLVIMINILLFLYELFLPRASLKGFIENYGVIPVKFFSLEESSPHQIFSRFSPLLTSIFLHGGWLHLFGNMWFLWVFGDNIEDRMGHLRFLLFYLSCGIAGGMAHIYLNPTSDLPSIGASGAISGILGAYFILYPFSRVLTLVPIFFFFYFVELPAFFFLGLWFLIQFFSGGISILAKESMTSGGVAWWAHIGGFIAGIVFLPFFLLGRKDRRRL